MLLGTTCRCKEDSETRLPGSLLVLVLVDELVELLVLVELVLLLVLEVVGCTHVNGVVVPVDGVGVVSQ